MYLPIQDLDTSSLNTLLFQTAVDCGPLPVLLTGSYKGDLTVYPNKVVSYCDEGFLLKGSVERFCQANRTWSGKQAICEGFVNLF